MNSESILAAKKLLNTSKNIVVIGHKNPDGDAIGSCLGLANYLRNQGHMVTTLMPNDFPDFLKWIPEANDVVIYENDHAKAKQLLSDAELIFTLDFNALNRIGELENLVAAADAEFILIDHHQQPDDYATVVYSDVMMSSTSQMVYRFIEALDGLDFINKEIATQLYVGIMTDTGSFRFPLTTPTTHRVIAHLIECGANNSKIHQQVYDTNSTNRLKLLGTALNNLVVLPEYRTAYISLSQEELNKHQFKKGDTEGFVNYALSINDVTFAAIFIENKSEDIVKISLRSIGDFSVNEFSRKHFNGGGHINAAGGRSEEPLNLTEKKFLDILPLYQNELQN